MDGYVLKSFTMNVTRGGTVREICSSRPWDTTRVVDAIHRNILTSLFSQGKPKLTEDMSFTRIPPLEIVSIQVHSPGEWNFSGLAKMVLDQTARIELVEKYMKLGLTPEMALTFMKSVSKKTFKAIGSAKKSQLIKGESLESCLTPKK